MEHNEQFWMEFLDIYKAHTELWYFKGHRSKYDETLKDGGYRILLRKYQEVVPEATKEMLIKKLNIFRSSYRRENKKVKESMRSGSSYVDIYKPKWPYYGKMQFLDEKGDDNTPLSSLDNDFTFIKTPKKRESCESELLNVAKELLKKELHAPESEDLYLFKWWYAKFEKLEEEQKELAQRICLDAVFAASKGTLNNEIRRRFHDSLPDAPSTSYNSSSFFTPPVNII